MVRLLQDQGLAVDRVRGARRVTSELLAAHDLVLVPERAHRAALTRLLPAARGRTFTMLEAAALADALAGEVAGPAALLGPATSSGDRVREWVRRMDLARGKVRLAGPETRSRGLRAALLGGADEPLDVVDVHGQSARAHRRALVQIEDATIRLVTGLAG
jgi:protein-tyrosine-phosphatase